jgi:hypothetical protein
MLLPTTPRNLLRLDAAGGLGAGAVVLALRVPIAALYAVDLDVVWLVGGANLAYGCFSGTLALVHTLAGRVPQAALTALAVANVFWGGFCLVLAAALLGHAGPLLFVHLGLEAVVVGGLGFYEWRVFGSARRP